MKIIELKDSEVFVPNLLQVCKERTFSDITIITNKKFNCNRNILSANSLFLKDHLQTCKDASINLVKLLDFKVLSSSSQRQTNECISLNATHIINRQQLSGNVDYNIKFLKNYDSINAILNYYDGNQLQVDDGNLEDLIKISFKLADIFLSSRISMVVKERITIDNCCQIEKLLDESYKNSKIHLIKGQELSGIHELRKFVLFFIINNFQIIDRNAFIQNASYTLMNCLLSEPNFTTVCICNTRRDEIDYLDLLYRWLFASKQFSILERKEFLNTLIEYIKFDGLDTKSLMILCHLWGNKLFRYSELVLEKLENSLRKAKNIGPVTGTSFQTNDRNNFMFAIQNHVVYVYNLDTNQWVDIKLIPVINKQLRFAINFDKVLYISYEDRVYVLSYSYENKTWLPNINKNFGLCFNYCYDDDSLYYFKDNRVYKSGENVGAKSFINKRNSICLFDVKNSKDIQYSHLFMIDDNSNAYSKLNQIIVTSKYISLRIGHATSSKFSVWLFDRNREKLRNLILPKTQYICLTKDYIIQMTNESILVHKYELESCSGFEYLFSIKKPFNDNNTFKSFVECNNHLIAVCNSGSIKSIKLSDFNQ